MNGRFCRVVPRVLAAALVSSAVARAGEQEIILPAGIHRPGVLVSGTRARAGCRLRSVCGSLSARDEARYRAPLTPVPNSSQRSLTAATKPFRFVDKRTPRPAPNERVPRTH
jgi:hypothetical protein